MLYVADMDSFIQSLKQSYEVCSIISICQMKNGGTEKLASPSLSRQ